MKVDAGSRVGLTSIGVQRGEGDLLVCRAGAVGALHLQLVPRGLLQVVRDVALGQRGALGRGPHRRVHGAVLQREGGDWTAAVVPAYQVEAHAGGVDACEELVFFGKLRFWEEEGMEGYDSFQNTE